MLNKRAYSYLLIILVLSLALRLYFSLQSSHFSSDEAYFHTRHVQYILDNKVPMTYDPLSYSGREIPYPPLYHYIIAAFSWLFKVELILKVLPAIFAVITSLIIYFIAYELTKDKIAALFSSLFSAFIPVFIATTLNSASIYSIVMPVFFFIIFCMIKLREERTYLVYLAIFSILFPLMHSSSFLLLLSMVVYSLILVSENLLIRKTMKEVMIFSALAILFIQFLIFKKAFLTYGISILWQNTPDNILASYLQSFSFTQAVYGIGILSSVLGIVAIFLIFFTSRKESHILIVSIFLSTLVAILSRLLSPGDGILFLSLTLAILSSLTISRLLSYIDISKISRKRNYFIYSIILLSLVLAVFPSILAAGSAMRDVPAEIDIEALAWIRDNINDTITIAALPEEGNLIANLANKSVVADSYYLLAPDPGERIMALSRLYESKSEFEALDITQRFGIDFIFVSEKAKSKYNITDLGYITSVKRCFDRRKYEDFGKIYQVRQC